MKTYLKIALPVLLVVVFAVAGTSNAQPYTPASPLYFGIFGGYVAPQDMNWSSKVTGASTDLSLDSSGMFGLKTGLHPTPGPGPCLRV